MYKYNKIIIDICISSKNFDTMIKPLLTEDDITLIVLTTIQFQFRYIELTLRANFMKGEIMTIHIA